jgi:hypothetical protein
MKLISSDPSTPSATEVQRILSHLEDDILAPYVLEPNRISRELYTSLPLPWDCKPPVDAFDEPSFFRHEWDVGGKLSNGEDFFGGTSETNLAQLGQALGTASMVTRWREANEKKPEIHRERDCVEVTIEELAKAMGVEPGKEGVAVIKTGGATVLLMLKKKA